MDSTPEHDDLLAQWLGQEDFDRCLQRQVDLREAVIGGAPERVLLVEHPPSVTLGRRATEGDVLWSPEQLRARDISVFETPRGGEATLHAPGQLVVYPVLHVGRYIRRLIVDLAESAIEVAAELGAQGMAFRMDHPGVWVGERKLASIGIHISRGVSIQGLSLNVDVDTGLFGALVSCGLPSVEMVSLAQLIDTPPPPLPELAQRFASALCRRRGRSLVFDDQSGEAC